LFDSLRAYWHLIWTAFFSQRTSPVNALPTFEHTPRAMYCAFSAVLNCGMFEHSAIGKSTHVPFLHAEDENPASTSTQQQIAFFMSYLPFASIGSTLASLNEPGEPAARDGQQR
jgi:hypothetical protein